MAEEQEPARDLGWHTMSGEYLMEALRRCHNGEHPEFVFMEMYANAIERESFADDEEEDE